MKYSLVIFDLDGTLADSFPWFLRVVNGVAREYGFKEIAPEQVDDLRRAGSREILKRLEVPLWKLPMIGARMRTLKRAHIDDIPLFPGVSDMLKALTASGVRLALVSSDNEANARRQLGTDAALFSEFDCGASLFGKAAKFSRLIKRTGVAPQNVIAIGDEVRDIEAAKSAGVAFGAVSWGYADAQALRGRKPEMMFESIEDITQRLTPAKN